MSSAAPLAAPPPPAAAPAAPAAPPPGAPGAAAAPLPGTKRARAASPGAVARAALRARLSACSAADDFGGALAAVEATAAGGATMPPPHAYNLLLNIASRARAPVARGVLDSALAVFGDMVARRVALTEASYASVIRLCALAGDAPRGAALLEQMKAAGLAPRLRSYAALVKAFAGAADVRATRALFADMAARGVAPSQAEHAALLRALAAAGAPAADALAHLRAIAADQPVLDAELAAALEETLRASAGAWACARVRVDRAAPRCPATGRTLRAIDASAEQLAALRAQTAALAGEAPDAAARFGAFRAWLAARDDFDVLVDGPNVGFFGQNHEGGALMYSQIEAVRAHFAAQGRRVLIVIGEKWLGAHAAANANVRRTVKRRTNFYAARARGETPAYVSRFAAAAAKSGGRAAAVDAPDAPPPPPPPLAAAGGSTFSGSHIWAAPDSDNAGNDASGGSCACRASVGRCGDRHRHLPCTHASGTIAGAA